MASVIGNADGSIIIDTRINTKGADKGVTSLKKQFTSLSGTAAKLAGAIGLAFSVTAVVQFGKEASKSAREASDALVGLRSILEGQGRSFAAAQQFINEYTEDGLIPATNAITAYKNLAMRGYDDSQIRQVMVFLRLPGLQTLLHRLSTLSLARKLGNLQNLWIL